MQVEQKNILGNMLIEYIPTYKYFSTFAEITSDKSILDFGSNCGNLLKSGKVLEKQYTGIDIDIQAIEEGKKLFPNANWIWYNRYNPVYNPTGVKELPVLHNNYDLIVSYSVFSHIESTDALELIELLYNKLTDKGKILFSYANVDNNECVEWFQKRRNQCDNIPSDDVVYLVDSRIAKTIPVKCNHFVTFYKTSWLLNKLSKFNPVSYMPPTGWYQDCMILSK